MILFLHGSEPFLIREKLQQIRAKAAAQGIDDLNTAELDGSEATAGAVGEAVTAMPFLAEQRLVIVRDWLLSRSAAESDELAEAIGATPQSTILAIAEYGAPDKRRSAFKNLTKQADKAWELNRLDEPAAARWLNQRANRLGAKLEASAARALVEAVGTDLWALATELDKLVTAANGKPLGAALIQELVIAQSNPNIFGLVDAIGRRDAATALKEFGELAESGEPPLRVLAMIIRQYRLLLGIQDGASRGLSDGAIAKEAGVQPFLLKKLRRQADSYTARELHRVYQELANIDYRIKTGRIDPEVAIELFIIETSASYADEAPRRS